MVNLEFPHQKEKFLTGKLDQEHRAGEPFVHYNHPRIIIVYALACMTRNINRKIRIHSHNFSTHWINTEMDGKLFPDDWLEFIAPHLGFQIKDSSDFFFISLLLHKNFIFPNDP